MGSAAVGDSEATLEHGCGSLASLDHQPHRIGIKLVSFVCGSRFRQKCNNLRKSQLAPLLALGFTYPEIGKRLDRFLRLLRMLSREWGCSLQPKKTVKCSLSVALSFRTIPVLGFTN